MEEKMNLYLKPEGHGVFRLCMHAPPDGETEGYGLAWKNAEQADRECLVEVLNQVLAANSGGSCSAKILKVI